MTLQQILVLIISGVIIYRLLFRPNKNQMQNNGAISWMRKKACLWYLEFFPLSIYRVAIANAIVDCVRANYSACGLDRPAGIANHLALWGKGVKVLKSGHIAFRYKFRRAPICPGGGIIQYSTVPLQTILATLNQSFGNYCIQYGWQPMVIRGKDFPNGLVYFAVIPFKSWNEAIGYLHSIGVAI